MSKSKNKYYVVWVGQNPGIYDSWNACKVQVHGFDGARYKGFKTKVEAKNAYEEGPEKSLKKSEVEEINTALFDGPNGPIANSISVDAACSGNPGKMEYQGVYTLSKTGIFHVGPFDDATNNVGEFLALVHALAWLKKKNLELPIYSDSRIAMGWVGRKHCNTKLARTAKNAKVFELIQRAEAWLKANSYKTKIMKWDTRNWGEIPADFGRK